MCELLVGSADRKRKLNSYLKTFFAHSGQHPNGWGLALFDGNAVTVEREPVRAENSLYLKHRLEASVEAADFIAHIRRATIGEDSFANTHPFVKKDASGRTWTLVHNGTVFEAPVLSPYQYRQEGTTDSERILLYLVDEIDRNFMEDLNSFDVNARFRVVEKVLKKLSPENKLNLAIYDGEYLYVHRNAPGTLYLQERNGSVLVATAPLDDNGWEEVPDNRLLVYRKGYRVYEGERHPYTYVEDEEKLKLLYLGYAGL